MLENNWIALLLTFIAALLWLRINDFAAHRGWVSSGLSRKIIHIGTGPIFVVCWLLYNPADPYSRYYALLVPFAITAQFVLVGAGVIKDEAAVKAMSRTGDRREILRGPLLYGIAFVVLTAVFWFDNMIGIVALMIMCGGDGLADIVGGRLGRKKLPWSPTKSWWGSAAMFFGGLVLAALVVWIFVIAKVFSGSILSYLFSITSMAFMATVVESLPMKEVDNLTIPISVILTGLLIHP